MARTRLRRISSVLSSRSWSVSAARKIEDHKPPIAALIAEIESEATVSRDVMTVSAKLQIEVLSEGWHYVHLRLNDAAVQSAQIGQNTARLIFEAGKVYWVLLEKKGREPRATGWSKGGVKLEGYAGLWFRADGPNQKVLAFDNMQKQ